MDKSLVSRCYIVPGQPHILLAKDRSPQWTALYKAYERVRQEIREAKPDLILYCSTQWLSVLGYMVQGDPEPQGLHVDPNWHEFGTMDYKFSVDTKFAQACGTEIMNLGHNCKVVHYKGFPIDTGTIVAQKLLNPDGQIPTAMVSCSIYGDQAETQSIGQALARTLDQQNKQAVVVLVSNLSNRYITHDIDPREDHIASTQDDEWNRRILSLLEKGALTDVIAQTGAFASQANADMGFKGIWWLAGLLGTGNHFTGQIFDYQAVWGTGAALVGLYPERPVRYAQDLASLATEPAFSSNYISTAAPEAVGPYPHARREGNLLFLSGIGPRVKGCKDIPGVSCDAAGQVLAYDITVQTHSVFQNIKTILEECGSSLAKVIDCQVFLTNMKEDFATFNTVYREYFNAESGPTRTTVEVSSLPTPIAVELKVIARV